jgi:Ankyrin repeats (many copies)/Zinc finger, ZZ type
VEFQLNHVLSKRTIRKRKDALGSLPSTIDDAYSGVIARIEKLEDDSKDLAIRTLSWIFHARRPLTMCELREAVAIEDNQVDLDVEDLPSPSDIIDCCGSLIIHDSSGIVRFAHYTVSSFLENKYIGHLLMQFDMARACLTYLCFDFFENGPDNSSFFKFQDDKWWNRKKAYNFSIYASVYWDSYTRGPGEFVLSVQEQLFRFLMSPSKCRSMLEIRDGSGSRFFIRRPEEQSKCTWRPWFHIVAGSGLASICRMVMEKDETKAAPCTLSSVDRATHKEIQELKEALKETIKRDMLMSATDSWGYTPLHKAAIGGHGEVVILLLENGADINARTTYGVTPLHLASNNGFSGVVSALLDNNADMTVEQSSGETPLAYAWMPDVIMAFRDKITKTTPWMLEELSTCDRHGNPSKSQIPKKLPSSFGLDLYWMLERQSQVPSPDLKYTRAYLTHWERSISLDPVSPSVTQADKLIYYGVYCDGCEISPLVGYRYKCTVCFDFDF